jgi:hypothetical protein
MLIVSTLLFYCSVFNAAYLLVFKPQYKEASSVASLLCGSKFAYYYLRILALLDQVNPTKKIK